MKIRVEKLVVYLLYFVMLNLIITYPVSADRETPAVIEPIIYGELTIMVDNTPDTMGIVKAVDTASGEMIWSNQLYKVRIKKRIEADTQWIFIKSMNVVSNSLIIVDEKDREYKLDPATGQTLVEADKRSVVQLLATLIFLSILSIFLFRRNRKMLRT